MKISGRGRVNIGGNCSCYGIPGDSSQYVTLETLNPEAKISIGLNATLMAARISSRFRITIGSDVIIEESGIADTDFHSIDRSRETPDDETVEQCEIIIGNRISIGAWSFVTKGSRLGDDVVVRPGSIITSTIPSGVKVLGNPAKKIE